MMISELSPFMKDMMAFWPLCVLIALYCNSPTNTACQSNAELLRDSTLAAILITISVFGTVIAWRAF